MDERMFAGPYPAIHDVATLLLLAGEDPASVDNFNKKQGIVVPFDGTAHHPMYDAVSAAVCWESLFLTLKGEIK
jgi:hypothetical protein